jgi:hypothetical protein
MRSYYGELIADGEEALSRLALLADLPSPRWGWLFVAGVCARRMVTHPFYYQGLSLWGQEARLWEKAAPRGATDPALYKPLNKAEAENVESFDSLENFIASLNA